MTLEDDFEVTLIDLAIRIIGAENELKRLRSIKSIMEVEKDFFCKNALRGLQKEVPEERGKKK